MENENLAVSTVNYHTILCSRTTQPIAQENVTAIQSEI